MASGPDSDGSTTDGAMEINVQRNRYPYCLVWTPIPLLTWLFPFIGHMGIATSNGIIRDFSMSYVVSTDDMAFGDPTRYLQLNVDKVTGGREAWDKAVDYASETYCKRLHILCWDNCHSHVSLALNHMRYKGFNSWNMCILAFWMFFRGHHTSLSGFIKTWLPFIVFISILLFIIIFSSLTT
ncbi:transmembrane protein 222 [Brevipalpus obovatus]|uniref:transmembrane protein 222 n=1 Tax=Brevipalpus obovatus TaxID=246614 RepID=UPI003D9E6224